MSKKLFALVSLVVMLGVTGAAVAESPTVATDQDITAMLGLNQESCDAPAVAVETVEVDLENELLAPMMGGEPCNETTCGPHEFCCNFSCSICAPRPDGVCTQQICTPGSGI